MSATQPQRKQAARLPRPAARYWKGKAPKGASDLPSSDESDTEDQDPSLQREPEEPGDEFIDTVEDEEEEEERAAPVAVATKGVRGKVQGVKVALRDVNISKEGRVIIAGKVESGKTQVEIEEEEEEEEEDDDEAEGKIAEDEEESSEYGTESESEEEPSKPQFRPMFVPKRGRETIVKRDALAQDTEEAIKKKEAEAEERKQQSHSMVAESIRRELLEKEKEEEVPDLDDTDGVDPEGEFEAWRLRELARIKRDKEEDLRREKEREEVERRRALPEEQRLKEDLEHAEKLRAEKPKGQQKFLQKYWHKGAFHQGEDILKRHDFTEATESTIDVSVLPKVMQVKNFGKRGRTKYTHLLDQDTSAGTGGFGGTAPVTAGGTSTTGGGCFLCGGPHMKKDCPQNKDLPPNRIGTGANGTPSGTRPWGERRPTEREDGKSSWRDRDREDGYDRNRENRRHNERRFERDGDRDIDRHRRWNDNSDGRRGDRDWDRGGKGDGYREKERRSRSRERSPKRDRWRGETGRKERRRSREKSLGRDEHDEKRRRVAT